VLYFFNTALNMSQGLHIQAYLALNVYTSI